MLLLAMKTLAFVAPRSSPGPAAAPTRRWAAEGSAAAPEVPADDGKVLDGSGFVGSVGALVIAVALLPYVALSLYSAFQLATQGEAFVPVLLNGNLAPTGVLGLGEGFGVVVVFGVVIWSSLSLLTRFCGLPEGPFGLLGFTQTLSYVSAVLFALAGFLNGLGEENPVRGVSFGSTPAQLEVVATKSSKLLNKAEAEVERITKEPRAELEAKIKEVEEQASSEFAKAPVPKLNLPDAKAPDIKVPDIKMPAFKMPDVKLPAFKAPDFKAPDFKAPDFKMPELKKPALTKSEPAKEPEKAAAKEETQEEKKEEAKVEAKEEKAEAPKKAESKKEEVADLFA